MNHLIAILRRLRGRRKNSGHQGAQNGHAHIGEHGGGAEVYSLGREPEPDVSPGQAISRESIVDLTAAMDHQGLLTWNVPEGEWTILRVGYTPTGSTNGASTVAGRGLDCDKLRRVGIEAVFAGMLDKLLAQNQAYRSNTMVPSKEANKKITAASSLLR